MSTAEASLNGSRTCRRVSLLFGCRSVTADDEAEKESLEKMDVLGSGSRTLRVLVFDERNGPQGSEDNRDYTVERGRRSRRVWNAPWQAASVYQRRKKKKKRTDKNCGKRKSATQSTARTNEQSRNVQKNRHKEYNNKNKPTVVRVVDVLLVFTWKARCNLRCR